MPWKKVHNYSLYEANSDGRVRSLFWNPPKVLKPGRMSQGYLTVSLYGESKMVHCLVLETFVGKRPKGYQARFMDGNKRNTRLSNLEWISRAEANQNQWSILTEDEVAEIKRLIEEGHQPSYLAREFRVGRSTLHDIATNKRWTRIKWPRGVRKLLSSHRKPIDGLIYTPGYARYKAKECHRCGTGIEVGALSWHDLNCSKHFCQLCLPCPALAIRRTA